MLTAPWLFFAIIFSLARLHPQHKAITWQGIEGAPSKKKRTP
jgi:hypothetical protein